MLIRLRKSMQQLDKIENIELNRQLNFSLSILGDLRPSQKYSREDAEYNILEWLLEWGFSTSRILIIRGNTNKYHLDRLYKNQFLSKKETAYGYPKFFYSLDVEGGYKLAEKLGTIRGSCRNFDWINSETITRYLMIQRLTLQSIERLSSFVTPKHYFSKGMKQPDCIWIAQNQRIGIALELETRNYMDFDDFMLMIVKCLDGDHNNILKLDHFIIFSTENWLVENFRHAFQRKNDQPLNIWGHNEEGKWGVISKVKIPFTILSKISIEHWDVKKLF